MKKTYYSFSRLGQPKPALQMSREAMLLQWIEDDPETFARKWRDEVLSREKLSPEKPRFLRVPLCLMTILHLTMQRVFMDENGAVYEIQHYAHRGDFVTGRQLVAPVTETQPA